jgi:hypothetical protein
MNLMAYNAALARFPEFPALQIPCPNAPQFKLPSSEAARLA